MKKTILIIIAMFVATNAYSQQDGGLRILTGDSVHLSMGIPKDADPKDDYIIVRPQYALSYNKNRGIPNWVSYELNSAWYGDAPRYSKNFISDTSLPDEFLLIKHSDYTNTGFDRGHMVRSEERTRTVEDNISTFYMTNIIPQKPDLNRGPWLDFEYFCEDLAKKFNKEMFVITGPVVSWDCRIDTNDRVVYPDSSFKIVVVLDSAQNIRNVNAETIVIAVVMPNIDGIRKRKWEEYLTSVRKLEELTSYDFLNFLPLSLQNTLETKKQLPDIKEKIEKLKKK